MRASMLVLAALFALWLPGATGESATGPNSAGAHAPSAPHARPAACALVEIRSDVDRRDRERFSATRILELRFAARLSGGPKPEQTLRLRLYTPGGFLYEVLAVPVAAGRGHRLVEARLPVAGTSIMASGLYGRWTVEPRVDDSSEPCGRSRHFVIRP